MTQRLLRLPSCLLFSLLFASSIMFAQQQSPYKNLRTALNTAVLDTISGIDLDVNESNPQPQHGNLNINVIVQGGSGNPYVFEVQYTPDPGFIGVDSFVLEYRYASTYPFQIYRGFKVTVLPSLVKAKVDFAVTTTGTPVTISPLANDEGVWGPLILGGLPLVNNGTATINGNQEVVFTPKPGFLGVAHIHYTVCDAIYTCQTSSIHIGVNSGQPLSDTIQVFTNRNKTLEIPLSFGGYQVFQAPANGIVVLLNNGSAFQYQPNTVFFGTDHFVLKATINGVDYFKTVDVKVYNVQSSNLMAIDDVRFTPRGQAISFNVRDNDIGNLLVRNWSVPNNFPGTISGTNGVGNVTFTPNPGFSGVATFFYKIGNSSAPALEVATVTIVVDNLAPPQLPLPLTTPKETPMVLHYDIPYPDFSFDVIAEPDHGEVEYFPGVSTQTINGQSVTGNNLLVYTPDGDYDGDDEFPILYCAPNGECQLSKVQVHVVEITASQPPFCIAECAWPGDANADGITNNKDLLPLGYAMGMDGTSRVDGSLVWYGQYASNWDDPFCELPQDLKHVDMDGNGLVNGNDVAAISENYRQVHNLFPKSFETGKGMPFFLNLLTPDPEIGDLVEIEILLGNDNFPALDAYGFTFDMNLGEGVMDSAFNMTFYDNSWLNLNAPFLTLAERPETGRFEMAFSRTNGQPISGQGAIGRVEFIIIDIIDGGGQNDRANVQLYPTATLADGSTTTGAPITLEIPIRTKDRSAMRVSEREEGLLAFPSPASSMLNVEWLNHMEVELLTLLNIHGSVLMTRTNLTGGQAQMDISDLPDGVYFLSATTVNGVITRKVQVHH